MEAEKTKKRNICIVYVLAMFTVSLDTTIVNVALATISNEFSLRPEETGMVNIGYLASLAFMLPMSGWLADRFGARRVFMFAFACFTAASLICGLAANVEMLNAGRIAQGAAGGLLTPVAMAILFRTFPPQERLTLSRALILPIALAPALGPIIGGAFVEYASWRFAFFINLPIGIIALALAGRSLTKEPGRQQERLDVKGLLLAGPGFASLLYALHLGHAEGWGSIFVQSLLCAGVACLITLVFVEWKQPSPLLNVRLYTNSLFRSMSLIMFACAGALLGLLYIFPLMYQQAFGATALESGLILFPEALGLMVASQLMPYSYRRIGPKRIIQIGVLITIVVYILLSQVTAEMNPWYIRSLCFSVGLFLGHAVGAVQTSAFLTIQNKEMSHATALFQVQNRLGSAVGVVFLSLLLAIPSDIWKVGTNLQTETPYRAAILGAVGLLIVALISATFISETDAKTAMEKAQQKQAAKEEVS